MIVNILFTKLFFFIIIITGVKIESFNFKVSLFKIREIVKVGSGGRERDDLVVRETQPPFTLAFACDSILNKTISL